LNNSDRRLARRLASFVRIAEGLDHSHRERISAIHATFQRGTVGLQLAVRGDASEDIRDASRSCDFLKRNFTLVCIFARSAVRLLPPFRCVWQDRMQAEDPEKCSYLLFAHGIAIDREDPKCPSDPERFLTPEGLKKTREAAKGFAAIEDSPKLFLSSPYVRALQTAEIFAGELHSSKSKIEKSESLLPGAEPARSSANFLTANRLKASSALAMRRNSTN